ncbi:MAG: Lipid A biosynthesis lauroyl acyltransferase [Candidatus Tokpelaia hoelldobleri]|uniref:Lipid A biosynthesis lauroyl acyltransferase n=1 Tax=Candidatus Tokpelaia hoelldobleri TaxID=1902579 RepID=A0A1U9JUU7_9HYPH|nr:MAG: Lipid A biosynthesis lauroyl acyltransferase [Candidatus Tokpelaia hoelldoblerii]
MKLIFFRIAIKLKDWWDWLWAHVVAAILAGMKYLPAKAGIGFFAGLARLVGPLTPRHKIALDNLRAAYPEKDEAEIRAIAIEMWVNMGRLFAEYVFLDKIFDFDPKVEKAGLIEVDGIELFEKIRDEKDKPHIFFTAHTGNFELLPICAATFDLEVTALFRPPNNPYIARRVLKARRTNMGHLVPSKAGAAWALAGKLNAGGNVGMLVDQKFRRGIEGAFFNRPVKTNPLLAKLARQFDCPVYPARCIRLPSGRYRLELYPEMELPRDANGAVDIEATTQKLNDIVESWVREYPGQWMWFHKRWDM